MIVSEKTIKKLKESSTDSLINQCSMLIIYNSTMSLGMEGNIQIFDSNFKMIKEINTILKSRINELGITHHIKSCEDCIKDLLKKRLVCLSNKDYIKVD